MRGQGAADGTINLGQGALRAANFAGGGSSVGGEAEEKKDDAVTGSELK
jgi:hypothetical protein